MVFLPAVPTSHTQRGRVTNICCWWDSDESRYAAEIHYLTPAAWGDPPFGGLRYETARDDHATDNSLFLYSYHYWQSQHPQPVGQNCRPGCNYFLAQ